MFNMDKLPLKLSLYVALSVFALNESPTLFRQKNIANIFYSCK